MQLLTGPAGSGKTFTALEALRAALRRKDGSVRLLVPTATMAQHLRNEMAREGFVFFPALIQTISRFIDPWAAGFPEVSEPLFHLLVEQSVRKLNSPEFAKVAHMAGFHARLATVIDECSTAGCDAEALRRHLPASGLGRALAEVFAEVSRVLDLRKLGMRSTRLGLAAAQIEEKGLGPIKSIWLDGFFSLTEPELAVVKALAGHASVTVTLTSADISLATRTRLKTLGFEERTLSRRRVSPKRELFAAPGIEREADEIARRILEEVAGGRLFREIGIIVRAQDTYVPLLRATLERFGIPARFYFDFVLMEQPAVRFLARAVDAMLGGWDHAETLTAMKLAPGAGISAPMDRFDFEVRKRLPGAGLDSLRLLATEIQHDDQRLRRLLDDLAELDGCRSLVLKPAEWSARLAQLRTLYRPGRPRDGMNHEAALEWRSQAQALDAFHDAVTDAASAFDPDAHFPLAEFWPAVKAALHLTPLRVVDRRRDVVHVLSAYEARQWDLPVAFVCGLVEGQFPHYQAPDPFLPDSVRRHLKDRGLRLRTADDVDREERFLFDSALSRASQSVILSYPKNDARGEQNLPSLFLDPAEPVTATRPVRLKPCHVIPAVPAGIHSGDLLQVLAEKHAEVRPTALESYLQCPFQFFGRHTLKLECAPPRPDERLDFKARGNIVHGVINEWLATREPIDEIFRRVFSRVMRDTFVPESYKTELLRGKMLADLRRLAECDPWPATYESQGELSCKFELDGGLVISCRIDRLIKTGDGRAFVIDYKYSPKTRDKLTDENLLQGPFYWLAAEKALGLRTAGMYYCALRDGLEYAGWGEKADCIAKAAIEPFTSEWLDAGVERAVRSAREIGAGRIAPDPSDLSRCRWCDFRDICRFEGAVAAVAEAAE